ncbi:MAG: OmpA family protein [Thermodesulfobacteriota bacterium]
MFRPRSMPALFLALAAALALATAPAAAQERFYSIQVSAYQEEAKAEQHVEDLKTWGLEAFYRSEEVEGKGLWFRVYVGRFSGKTEAMAEAERLKAEGVIPDFVVRQVDTTKVAAAPGPPVTEPPAVEPTEPEPVEPPAAEPAEPEPVEPPLAEPAEPEPLEPPLAEPPAGPTSPVQPQDTAEPGGLKEEPLEPAPAVQPEPGPEAAPGPRTEPQPAAVPGLPAGVVAADPPPDSWEIIIDLSGSTREQFECSGFSKQEAQFTILRKMNVKMPDLEYQAVLRQFAYKRALTRDDYTKLVYGPRKFDRKEFQAAILTLQQSDAITPLGWSLAAAEQELAVMPGKKALVILSDFKHNPADFGQPLDRAERLVRLFGDDLNIFTICSSVDVTNIRLAKEMAKASRGGKYYDGCKLVKDEVYFDTMMAEIFGVYVKPPEPVCVDEDGDTICDDQDQCPHTPKGAPVDNRGCWITAFSQFFDFDKALVKEEFLPRIKSSAEIIINNPHLIILIAGHTDNKGTDEYNMKLGLRRAEAVRDKLVEFGVSPERLKVESHGESQPIADNDTEEGRAQNRRVELHVWEPGTGGGQ